MNKKVINILMLIKAASIHSKKTALVPKKKSSFFILNSLYKEGIIQNFLTINFLNKTRSKCLIYLRYSQHNLLSEKIKIISKPSKILYLTFYDISLLYDKNHLLFLSTSRGILTNFECKLYGIGGLALFSC